MTDPCKWCDGRTVWNGSEYTTRESCPDEEYCDYYQKYIRQQEEADFIRSELEHGAIRPGIYADDFLEI